MRDYDPTTGRYIQADPLGFIDGASVYGYALQNPGRYVDPRGEFGVVGALGGAAVNVGIQLTINYLKLGFDERMWRCIDLRKVAVAAAFGAIGGSAFRALKSDRIGEAAGTAALQAYTGNITVPTPIPVDPNCDCSMDPNSILGKSMGSSPKLDAVLNFLTSLS